MITDPRVPAPERTIAVADGPVAAGIGTWPGVVELCTGTGDAIQIGATSDCRRFAASRLGEDPDAPPTRATLRDDTARVLVYRAASAFEADWLALTIARERLPALHAELAARLRPPALVLRPDTGTWDARELDPSDPIDPKSRVIAPIRTLEGARRLGAAIDEHFDLCRYPKEVLRAPRGTACAYKEMGKCPAPCDGSEPLADYLDRFALAARTLEAGVPAWIDAQRTAMDDAARATDFERAASHKRTLDELQTLPDDVRAGARALGGRVFAVVSRAPRRARCRLWALGADGLIPLATLEARARRDTLARVLDTLRAQAPFDPAGATRPALEEYGLVARALHHKPQAGTTKRTRVLDAHDATPATLADALAACAGLDRTNDPNPEGPGPDDPRPDEPDDPDREDPLSYNTA